MQMRRDELVERIAEEVQKAVRRHEDEERQNGGCVIA